MTNMDTAALMKRMALLLDGVTETGNAVEIILPVLKEYGQGIPDEVLAGMAETLFLEILEERNRSGEPESPATGENMIQNSVTNSIMESAAESVVEPAAEPAAEPAVKPVTESFVEPAVESEPSAMSGATLPGSENLMETEFYPMSFPETLPAREPASNAPEAMPSRTLTAETGRDEPMLPAVVSEANVSVPEKAPHLFDERIFPRWIVDWGGSLPMSGALLSPKFLVLAPHFESKPRVLMELDERLTCPYWNRTPSLSSEADGVWSYYEQLNINIDETFTAGREYLLRVRVVFHENEGRNVYCFQGTMRIKVPDTLQAQRTLEISGEGVSLINLSSTDLAEFQRVRITGGDQTLINVQSGWTPPENDGSESRHHLVELRLAPDVVARSIIPRKSSIPVPSFRSERIILASEDGEQQFFLFAKPNLLVGRSAEETLTSEACDIVTRLYHPKFEEIDYFDEDLIWSSRFLTRLFSRNHCETEVMPRGFRVADSNSTLGTFVAGQQLDNSQVLAEWKHLERGLSIVVGGLLELIVKAHVDPTWRRLASLNIFRDEELEGFYAQAVFGDSLSFHTQGMSGLWKLAVDQGNCDAILISRKKQLAFDRFREAIIQRIRSRTDRAEQILSDLESSLRHCKYDPFAKGREYIVLFRSATIGGGRDDAISLANSGLGEGMARILSINKMFWIEPLQVDCHSIRVDGNVLDRNELCPLAPGQTLHLGERRFTIKSFDAV